MNIKFIYAVLIITIVASLTAHSLVRHAQNLGAAIEMNDENTIVSQNVLNDQIIGVWASEGSINSDFEITPTAIIYTEDDSRTNYRYTLKNNLLTVFYEGDPSVWNISMPDKATLIFHNTIAGQSSDEDTVFHRFSSTTNPTSEDMTKDLISFNVVSGQKVSGKINVAGVIRGGYFFEGNILVNVLDAQKKLLKAGHADATTDWMTSGPVSFKGVIDISNIKNGPAFVEIHNDNASGESKYDKSILIPVVIENKK